MTTEEKQKTIETHLSQIAMVLGRLVDVQRENNRLLRQLNNEIRRSTITIKREETDTMIIPEGFELVPSNIIQQKRNPDE